MGKIDIVKAFKDEYKAPKKPAVIAVPEGLYLAVDGGGAPGEEDFQTALEALYGMAYTIKMGRKKDGKGDYTIGKLEAVYWTDDGAECDPAAMDRWRWRMMIRTPEEVDGFPITDDDLDLARERLRARNKDAGSDRVCLVRQGEGPCVQMLHVGPYENEHETIAAMTAFMEAEGLDPHGRHHEIYLSDPRRVPPEKLKTILRRPVSTRG